MEFSIRQYQPSDLQALGQICLQTGNNGQDATSMYNNPDLLSLYYTAPYAVLEPDIAYVLVQGTKPCGYMLGTRDLFEFCEHCEQYWFPALRDRFPCPEETDFSHDAEMIRLIHAGHVPDEQITAEYPAELHLDLLPVAQSKGWGTKLMQMFLGRLRRLRVPGVHLSVGQTNHRAIGFYEHQGFQTLVTTGSSLVMGRRL